MSNKNPNQPPQAAEESLMTPTGLPENAFRELGADEEYKPVTHPVREQKEVTFYSVAWAC